MSAEQQPPPIVEPKEFLSRPFQGIEIGRLASKPDIELLRFLPTLRDEVGLILQGSTWYAIKASETGLPSYLMPEISDLLLHSHPIDEDEESNDGSFPSVRDFLNCSPTAKNLIVSFKGITRFWRVEGEARREFERELWSNRFGRGSRIQYFGFLTENGARYNTHKWNDLSEEDLTNLLKPTSY